eukprot:1514579-Amphidinium_carterae.1
MKASAKWVVPALTAVCNLCAQRRTLPDAWLGALVVPIWKRKQSAQAATALCASCHKVTNLPRVSSWTSSLVLCMWMSKNALQNEQKS